MRFRGRPTAPVAAGVNVSVQLTPSPGHAAPPCPPPASVGDCTPAIAGLQYCHFNDSPFTLTSDAGTPPTYTLGESAEEPVCADEDLVFTLSGGYVDNTQDGWYVFQLAGEHCACDIEWVYEFAQDASPSWTDLLYPVVAGDALLIEVRGSGTYSKGIASVSAICRGVTYGPITITLSSIY